MIFFFIFTWLQVEEEKYKIISLIQLGCCIFCIYSSNSNIWEHQNTSGLLCFLSTVKTTNFFMYLNFMYFEFGNNFFSVFFWTLFHGLECSKRYNNKKKKDQKFICNKYLYDFSLFFFCLQTVSFNY